MKNSTSTTHHACLSILYDLSPKCSLALNGQPLWQGVHASWGLTTPKVRNSWYWAKLSVLSETSTHCPSSITPEPHQASQMPFSKTAVIMPLCILPSPDSQSPFLEYDSVLSPFIIQVNLFWTCSSLSMSFHFQSRDWLATMSMV